MITRETPNIRQYNRQHIQSTLQLVAFHTESSRVNTFKNHPLSGPARSLDKNPCLSKVEARTSVVLAESNKVARRPLRRVVFKGVYDRCAVC